MLTRLQIRNFKLFDSVDLELGDRVVLIGPNNAGKTTALQALALWDIGRRLWIEKRGTGVVPVRKRTGVTINRRDLIAVPVPAANLLWRDLHVRSGSRENGKARTDNVLIEIVVDGVDWSCGLEFDYANSESFYCRPLRLSAKDRVPDEPAAAEPAAAERMAAERMEVPPQAADVSVAFLPPMSGLAANETRLDPGAVNVRLGEGRTADVLRNLCYQITEGEDGAAKWQAITGRIEALFGSRLDPPRYVAERGEITMTYRNRDNVPLDLSASGRGQQQTLLLLAHMTVNPGSVLLLDEPDAHLEILRQREIYQLLGEVAEGTGSQIIAASHSEVILNEAADRDVLIAFVGKPHRIDDRGSQVAKALKEIGFEHYLQAEEQGWVLYLEGSTDLAILLALARTLDHPAARLLQGPYVHYVANQPRKAQEHFYGVREAKPDLVGVAIYDRLEVSLPSDPNLVQLMWQRRELENYLCQRDVLLAFATADGSRHEGELFAPAWRDAMDAAMNEIEQALETLGEPSPWGADLKVSEAFLARVFKRYYERLERPNLMAKSDYHRLAGFVPRDNVDPEVIAKLDEIVAVAERARPRGQ